MSKFNLFNEPLRGGNIYHVFGHINGHGKLYLRNKDRKKFLKNLLTFVSPFCNFLSFNLQGNHYHLVIEIFEKEYCLSTLPKAFIYSLPPGCLSLMLADEDNMPKIMANRIGSALQGYSAYFNFWSNRKGNLLIRPFSRKHIHKEDYLKKAVYYVHANAIKHGIVTRLIDYQWTSFQDVISNDDFLINLSRLYELFGGHQVFIDYHKQTHHFEDEEKFAIEKRDDIPEDDIPLDDTTRDDIPRDVG